LVHSLRPVLGLLPQPELLTKMANERLRAFRARAIKSEGISNSKSV
jgi:hypothetical protein